MTERPTRADASASDRSALASLARLLEQARRGRPGASFDLSYHDAAATYRAASSADARFAT